MPPSGYNIFVVMSRKLGLGDQIDEHAGCSKDQQQTGDEAKGPAAGQTAKQHRDMHRKKHRTGVGDGVEGNGQYHAKSNTNGRKRNV